MDDFAACADLCEKHGFPGPANALRSLAEGRGRFYLVRALMNPFDVEYYGFEAEDVMPTGRNVFLDRAAADRLVRSLIVRALRNRKLTKYNENPSNLPDDEYVRQVGAILGVAYRAPEGLGTRVYPDWVTDEQLWRVGQLLDLKPFDVSEFGGDLGQPAPEP